MRSIFAIIFLFFLPSLVAQLEINEIMYAPTTELGGSTNEWIELYNSANESMSLEGCFLDGKVFENLSMGAHHYVIIARDEDKFNEFYNSTVPIVKNTFALNNNEDIINVTCGNVTSLVHYSKEQGAYRNNKTLERNKIGEWKESLSEKGSPGAENSNYHFDYDYSTLRISEVMVDPFGDDAALKPLGEWIEIYNSGKNPILLNDLILYDEDESHELFITESNTKSLQLCPYCYAVIYRNGDSDFDLSKRKDKVRLFATTTLIDEVIFSNIEEGNSLSKINNEWFQTIATPEQENIYSGGCDWGLDIQTNNSIFRNDNLTFTIKAERNFGLAEPITVSGKIENIFGEVIKEYSPWTNHTLTSGARKTYSPNLAEGSYQLVFELQQLHCEDQNPVNNIVRKLVAVNPQYLENQSSVSIEKLYLGNDDAVEWGDQFTVKLNIYRGDETKKTITAWADKGGITISKRTKITVDEKYNTYPVTIPIQLEPNCNQKIDDGKANLIVEGLDLHEEESFTIEGIDTEICKDYFSYAKEEKAASKQKISLQLNSLPEEITPTDVFPLEIQILNDNQDHDFELWAYLYRGKKCYSCLNSTIERDHNKLRFSLAANELHVKNIPLKLDDSLQEETYNIKVSLRKDQQKTTIDFTTNISVRDGVLESSFTEEAFPLVSTSNGATVEHSNSSVFIPTTAQKGLSHFIVYESSSQKAQKMIPLFLAVSFGLLLFLVIFKK